MESLLLAIIVALLTALLAVVGWMGSKFHEMLSEIRTVVSALTARQAALEQWKEDHEHLHEIRWP